MKLMVFGAALAALFFGVGWDAWSKTQAPLFATNSVVAITAELVNDDPIASLLLGLNAQHKQIITSSGTGFAIGKRIYTCEHVINNAKNIYVELRDGRYQWGRLLRSNKDSDLAEIQIGDMPPALRMRSYPPRFFETVYQIGNPGSLHWVLTRGNFVTFDSQENRFLLDTWFGNSGSPIMDRSGLVIGMTHDIIRGTRFTGGGTLQDLYNFIYPEKPR